ncbi:hypothetical protein HY745_04920 [Candidatus Desantisbacteria bacterium]|nr:hypothetical protein [Candidatus Desantisbacteria bacterium]
MSKFCFENLCNLSKEQLDSIPEIGPKMIESITDFFQDKNIRYILNKFKKAGLKLSLEENMQNSSIANKIFVLTGTLKKYSRNEAVRLIEKYGGKVSSGVSKNTDFVLAGDDPGSKFDKAKKIGVKIINEEEFEKILNPDSI